MTPMLKILLFPLWTISVQLKRTFPVGPLPDLMGTEIRKWCGQNSPWTNCFQSTKPQSSWQSHFFFLPRFIFFAWVTDLSLINYPARISAVLFSNLYFFPHLFWEEETEFVREVGRVSVKFLFLRHHAFCPFPSPSVWHTNITGPQWSL